ncbi:MAG: CoA ester lyase [Candidatus Cloacimonadota bacterium]|nr:CoA ester lyase [Candidatus Cloacimonadota bacterium]
MNKTKYLLRSLLFVPGNLPDLIVKAAKTKADALILDLEDSVADADKELARQKIKKIVDSGVLNNKQVFVRLNDIDSGLMEQEVYDLLHENLLGFLVPKIYDDEGIEYFCGLLNQAEMEKGFPKNKFKMIPLIETTSAVLNLMKICLASSRIIAIAFGSEDYLADLQGFHNEPEKAFQFPREMIANSARATGIIPIDTLNIDVHNLDKLRRKLQLTKILGFEGSLLLHPKEIELANKYYSPYPEEVKRAKRIIELSEETSRNNKPVKVVNGIFVGPPLVRKAKQLLEKHEFIRKIEGK